MPKFEYLQRTEGVTSLKSCHFEKKGINKTKSKCIHITYHIYIYIYVLFYLQEPKEFLYGISICIVKCQMSNNCEFSIAT